MAFLFQDLQDEVKRRSVRNESGTTFDAAIKNIINTSLFRTARAAHWKNLRRKTTFDTVAGQTSGTFNLTNGSASFTGSGLSLITNGVEVGRRLDLGDSSTPFVIETITGENAGTLNKAYDGTTDSSATYEIFGKEEYTLPIQTGKIALMWHEAYGYPYVLDYIPSMSYFSTGIDLNSDGVPTCYREWGEDDVLQQPIEASVITVVSSDSNDTSKEITVFGTVGGYPDFEVISTDSSDGTTSSAGSKSFTSVERITKDSSTDGRITCTSNSGNVTVSVLPVGDSSGRVQYRKIQLSPLPDDVYPINVYYYKDPWRLVNSGDVHELGADFDEAIIALAVSKIKFENSQKEGKEWFALWKDEIMSLRKKNADKLDFIYSLKRPSSSRLTSGRLHKNLTYAQLGGNFGPMGY